MPDLITGAASEFESLARLLRGAGIDRGDVHARDSVDDVVDQAFGHEAGAGNGDPHRHTLLLATSQQRVGDDHAIGFPSQSGQVRSFSEIRVTSRGQVIPKAGSSKRCAFSAPGAYGPET